MNKVTIIMPLYNNKEDVITAIQSVINQTYRVWELIIVDDCSNDGTYEFVTRWLSHSPFNDRIAVHRNSTNKGCYCSINEGLLRMTGQFITRIDSDDRFSPQKLEKQVLFLEENPDVVAVCGISVRGNTRIRDNEVTLM